jgi:hypothetical protein
MITTLIDSIFEVDDSLAGDKVISNVRRLTIDNTE